VVAAPTLSLTDAPAAPLVVKVPAAGAKKPAPKAPAAKAPAPKAKAK
jgi:hypothetical protein